MAKAVSDGSRRIVASIAPRPRLKLPVISRYACGASIGNAAPARTSGLPKSEIDSMNTTKKALKIPGRASGKVTFQNACHLLAPMLNAASSSVGLIDWSTPRSDR